MTATRLDPGPVCIAMGGDEGYAPGLAALGRSVIEHTPAGRRLDLYVFDGGLLPATRARLAASWTGDNVEVHWLPIDRGVLADNDLRELAAAPAAAAPLLLHAVLPGEVKRILFLDADTLVLSDLTPLWDADLAGRALGAVRDTMIPNIRNDGLPESLARLGSLPYFNSGVLLIDLARWRQERRGERAVALAASFAGQYWSGDQQPLNWAVAGRWKALPLVWNRMTHLLAIPSHRCTPFPQEEFEEALHRPLIAHFAGSEKPWHPQCWDDRAPDFRRQLRNTAWADWELPSRSHARQLTDDLVRHPHRRYRFVRRGLRLARQEQLPRWPWYLSAARVAMRYPWSPATYLGQRLISGHR